MYSKMFEIYQCGEHPLQCPCIVQYCVYIVYLDKSELVSDSTTASDTIHCSKSTEFVQTISSSIEKSIECVVVVATHRKETLQIDVMGVPTRCVCYAN